MAFLEMARAYEQMAFDETDASWRKYYLREARRCYLAHKSACKKAS